MKRSLKVAISMPEDLLSAVDDAREIAGSSRSRFFRDAAETHLRLAEKSAVEKYVAAYRDQPETLDEVATAMAGAMDLLAAEPFE